MKKVLLLLFVSLLLAPFALMAEGQAEVPAAPVLAVDPVEEAVNAYFANMPDHIYKIGQADFINMVKAGDDMVVVDIRRADDYAAGHIKGAVNMPWGPAIAEGLSSLPQNKQVFIYCYTGQTAGQAVVTLNVAGINARSVNLGWNLGISKVEGVAAVTETKANTLPSADNAVDPAIAAAVKNYYANLGAAPFASNIVSEENAKKILDAGDDSVLFVSVRKAADYAEGHIDGAVNQPWGKGMQDGFSSLPMDKKLIVYCYTGQTAGQVVGGLRLLGYDAVSLKGGMGMAANAPSGWANQGYPVVK